MIRVPTAVAGLSGWQRLGVAILSGVLAAAALPPFNLVPLLLVAFPVLVWLVDGARTWRAAAFIGWGFGFGFFAAGLHWLAYPLLVDGDLFAWLVPFTVVGVPAGLAIFPAAAALAVPLSRTTGFRRVVVLALSWTAAEWIRGHFLTGFPWNLIGYTWTVSDAMLQVTAVTGIYGLTLLTVLVAAAPAAMAPDPGARPNETSAPGRPRGAAWTLGLFVAACLGVVWGAGAIRLGNAETGFTETRVRVVQPAIAQRNKWRVDLREANLERHIALSVVGGDAVDVVIWPETAATLALVEKGVVANRIAGALPPGAVLITGAFRFQGGRENLRAWNSLRVVDPNASFAATYDKHHLVPFGEFVPLRSVLGALGLKKITEGSLDISAGSGPATLHVEGLPPFSPLICYEAIFPGAVTDPGDRPQWLLGITNDAWFGPLAGPAQHFEMARVRAIEEGLPMVRAANTGISALVDPYGRVLQRIGLGDAGTINGVLPVATKSQPLYARFGDWTAAVVWVLTAVLLLPGATRLRRIFVGGRGSNCNPDNR